VQSSPASIFALKVPKRCRAGIRLPSNFSASFERSVTGTLFECLGISYGARAQLVREFVKRGGVHSKNYTFQSLKKAIN